MEMYNKIMLYFWLLLSIVATIVVTVMGFREGFDRWSYYYVIPLIALMMFFGKRWMMKRFKKHMEYLNEKNKGQ